MFNIFQKQEKNMHYLNLYSNLSQSVVPLHSHNNSLVNPISSNLTLASINNDSKAIQNGKGNKNNSTSKRTRQTSHKFKNELCRVCGDKASGYHYKAITCEGCKVFFLRCVATNAQFNACHSGGNCEMDLYTRRKCQYCRFQKCLSVGMKPECVVLDRQRSRQTAEKQNGSSAPVPNSSGTTKGVVVVVSCSHVPPSSPTHSSSTLSPPGPPTVGRASALASPHAGPGTPVSPLAPPSGKISAAAIIAASRAATTSTPLNGSIQDGARNFGLGHGGTKPPITPLNPNQQDQAKGYTNGHHYPLGGTLNGSVSSCHHPNDNKTDADGAAVPQTSGSLGKGTTALDHQAMDETELYAECLDRTIPASPLNDGGHVNGSGWERPLPVTCFPQGGAPPPGVQTQAAAAAAALLQGEQRKLIERLVFYQDQFELPSEDVVRGIEEFFENDKKTNHNEKMFLMMAQFSMLNIQLIIEFSKRLPGFQTLVRQDQITILKACMYEIMLIKTARRYDINTDTIVCGNNKPYTRENFKIAGIVEVCDSMFDFCRGMALLKVDNAEYALLTSICLFQERPALLEPKKVEIIQEYYLDTLRSYIDCHRPWGSNMLARLLVKLRDLRELNNNHLSMLYSLKVQNFQIPPLMAELWDLPDNFQN